MLNQNTAPTTEALEAADLVPLALIATETGLSVDRLVHRFGDAVVLDDVGMRSAPVEAARQFFTERREWKAKFDADARRRSAERADKVPVKGVPAQEGMTPFESLLAATDEYVTPSQEFGMGGGTTTRELMDEQFAEGARRMAERRRRAAERKAAALAEEAKDDLGRADQ